MSHTEQELREALDDILPLAPGHRAEFEQEQHALSNAITELTAARALLAEARPIIEDYAQQVDHQASCDYWRWDIPGGRCNCLKTTARAWLAKTGEQTQ